MTINEAIKESGTSILFSGKTIKSAESKLQKDETVQYALITNIISEGMHGNLRPENVSIKDALKNKVAGVIVITNFRIYFCGGLIFKEIKISDIKSIDSAKSLVGNGQIRVQSNTDMIVFDIKCKKMNDVEQILTDMRNVSKTIQGSTTEDYAELRNLKKLLDDGIINYDDFERKKKQLLGI